MTREEVVTILHRLKRRMGKERAFYWRIEKDAFARGDSTQRERAYGEANAVSLAMGMVDVEIRKLRTDSATKNIVDKKPNAG